MRTGWQMYDNAVEYFGSAYLEGLTDSVAYRDVHTELLGPYTIEEAQERVDMYEHLFPRILIAREILERSYKTLTELWLNPGTDVIAYNQVIADLIAAHPTYRLAFSEDELDYRHDCFSTVQWLHGWLQSEKVDQQG